MTLNLCINLLLTWLKNVWETFLSKLLVCIKSYNILSVTISILKKSSVHVIITLTKTVLQSMDRGDYVSLRSL